MMHATACYHIGAMVSANPLVLVVDDNKVMHRIVERTLRARGADLITTELPSEALPLIVRHRPTLVLLDMLMASMSGTSVVKLVRDDPRVSKTCIFLHSAIREDVLAQRARQCGADGFIAKARGITHLAQCIMHQLYPKDPCEGDVSEPPWAPASSRAQPLSEDNHVRKPWR
jgi:CheY-like chemotaxis protein